MKKLALLLLALSAWTTGHAQTQLGVSIGVQQPGLYGRIDIGNFGPPPLVYAQPIVMVHSPLAMQRTPIYLYVPPGHQRDWGRHCARYGACAQPVYFVQEDWVQGHDTRGHRRGHGGSRKHRHHDD